jgi:hypothetical protein
VALSFKNLNFGVDFFVESLEGLYIVTRERERCSRLMCNLDMKEIDHSLTHSLDATV